MSLNFVLTSLVIIGYIPNLVNSDIGVTGGVTIGHMNTTLSVTCTLHNITLDNEAEVEWNKGDVELADVAGYSIDNSRIDTSFSSILTVDGSVNNRDDAYDCKFTFLNSTYNNTSRIFLFIVTPHGGDVKRGDNAELSCVMTDIVKNLTVTWEDSSGVDMSTLAGYSYTSGINVAGVQTSVLSITETNKSENYTCTLYPGPKPYSTTVELLVSGGSRVQSALLGLCLALLSY